MKKVTEIELVFENVTGCILKPDMFKYLILREIKEDLTVNCYQYENGETKSLKTCEYVHIQINKKGLEQFVPMDECNLERKLYMQDIVAIEIIGDKKQTIYVPWNDEDDFTNKYQKVKRLDDDNIEIEIQGSD